MLGDQQDMLRRIKTVLPARWFADASPVLDGVLSGLAAGWRGFTACSASSWRRRALRRRPVCGST